MYEYIALMSQTIRNWTLNSSEFTDEINSKVLESLRWDFGYADMSADDYRDNYRNRHGEIIQHVAFVVKDWVYDTSNELPDGFAKDLYRDLLDYGNAALWEDVAEVFVPTPDDYEESL